LNAAQVSRSAPNQLQLRAYRWPNAKAPLDELRDGSALMGVSWCCTELESDDAQGVERLPRLASEYRWDCCLPKKI